MMKYLNLEVKVVTPFTFTNYEHNVTDEDFVFCISQSGCSTNTIKALRKCRELGIPAIGLTGNVNSDFKTEADLVVDYGVGNLFSLSSSLKFKISPCILYINFFIKN